MKHFRLSVLLGCALTLMGAGCTGRGGQVQPGHDSPEAAVEGAFTNLQATPSVACEYVVPSEQSRCRSAAAEAHVILQGFSLGHTAVEGNRALVTVMADKFCSGRTGDQCYSNH